MLFLKNNYPNTKYAGKSLKTQKILHPQVTSQIEMHLSITIWREDGRLTYITLAKMGGQNIIVKKNVRIGVKNLLWYVILETIHLKET